MEEELTLDKSGNMLASLNGFIWQIVSFSSRLWCVETGVSVWRVRLKRKRQNGSFEYSKGYVVGKRG
ncbi:hypothetical protein COU15_00080 [Candidatus Kaiserbacteria bacterium CG10_big_fil_rev_8_21_14_0_10_45_20]|uniref:Uncharacterized protein n=1 Tax=Candidatus Kaiserbacteria bacterium CG10_big_fil_rev_8_21_14_0_10_45_20 TaxID=1974607 RepID=A0A2H0UGJ2_9BACT|nr:MAG: hypothetical protein COU15_00080 [Candidatus Kaiserbacteria bacterium CG10_big_fil_rev_8_21_14_0_10_45_20]